ncbi:MAG TPA: hypothetical protein VFF98_04260 [Novosphingobium sp.]|nr:hypothetical protein [Novosphingobium sp.]
MSAARQWLAAALGLADSAITPEWEARCLAHWQADGAVLARGVAALGAEAFFDCPAASAEALLAGKARQS